MHLDSVILLAGGLRPSPLVQAVGVSVLDLPLRIDQTVLERWLISLDKTLGQHASDLESAVVAYTSNSPQPAIPRTSDRFASLRFVCDQTGLRGPAGTARDLSRSLDEDATVLLGEAARFLRSDLADFIRAHQDANAETTIGRNPDGSPAGLYLTTRSVLDLVPEEGFMDLKEQWLNKAVAAGRSIHVYTFEQPVSYPLRLWEQYLHAVRLCNSESRLEMAGLRFSRTEENEIVNATLKLPGARVADSSTIVDSVLMPDCEVAEDALVVRSFVGSGVIVERGQTVVDSILQQGRLSPANTKPGSRKSMTLNRRGDGTPS